MISPQRLLLHGWGFDAKVMQPLSVALRERSPTRLLDVPGVTEKEKGKRIHTLREAADHLSKSISGPTIMIGWSLGGNIAIHTARYFSSAKIKALILVACNPSFLMRADWSCGQDLAALVFLQTVLSRNKKAAIEKFTDWCATGGRSVKKSRGVLLEYAKIANTSQRSLEFGLEILRSVDQREDLAYLECPVLMLFAENDLIIPMEAADYSTRLSDQITVKIVSKCGHDLPVSKPSYVAREIEEFINSKYLENG